jgi:hypothetical protein
LRGGAYLAQLESPDRIFIRETTTCEGRNFATSVLAANRIRTAALSDFVIWQKYDSTFGGSEVGELRSADVFGSNPTSYWSFNLKLDKIEISPDGSDIVVQEGEKLLRIPITDSGLLRIAERELVREFSKSECDEFFPGIECPRLR